jgi:hypothetical protein
MAYSEGEGLRAMQIFGATMSHTSSVSRSGSQPDQAIADAFDLLHRLTNLVEAFGNLSGPHPVTNCGARKS